MRDRMIEAGGKARVGLIVTLAAVIGLGIGGFYAYCVFGPGGKPSGPGPGTSSVLVRIGSFSKATDYAPYLVAKSKGWIEESLTPLGAKPEYIEFQTLPSINEALAAKRVDFIFEAEPPAIVGRAAGNDIRIITLSCTLTIQAIVPTSSQAKSLSDLKGQKIAVLAGTGAHYGLVSRAKQLGLADGDLQYADLIPPDARAAFESNQVAAWGVWPPWAEQEVVVAKARFLDGTDTPIQSILVVREDFRKDQPALTEAVVRAIDRAKEWIGQNPDAAMATIASELSLPIEVVKLAWPRHDWKARFSEPVLADLQAKADFLVAQKMIQNSVNVKRDLMSPMGSSK